MFPGIANGFFLDVGSGDGYLISNTQALEARGWKGICVDPFPTNMGGRTCHGEYVIQGGAEKRLNLFSAPPLAPSPLSLPLAIKSFACLRKSAKVSGGVKFPAHCPSLGTAIPIASP
jgi:hypothetical protein